MKTSALLLGVGIVVATAAASAQPLRFRPPMTELDRVLLGAPVRLRDGATVIKWRPDYTYETLKPGTNGLVCYDRSGEDRRYTFAVQCTNEGNLPRVAQNRRFRAESKTAADEKVMVDAAEKNGTRVKPEYGSTWINTNGDDLAHLRVHTTIAVPGATAESTGLPDAPRQSGAWIMDAGTTSAHVMLPSLYSTRLFPAW